ncbi:MAG: GNAT family protein [Fimbriimonas sp.]|nr:GNAT family protein [Fimbriimonas sp.]
MPFHFPTLTGPSIRIRPLLAEDAANLAGLTSLETFKYYVTSVPTSQDPEGWQPFVDYILNTPSIHGQVIEDLQTGQILGMSNYLDIREVDLQVEVGMTWYIESKRGTKLNPEAKLLVLTHAFETLGCVKVTLKADDRNEHSKAAILKLGAKPEGVFKKHRLTPWAEFRDTAWFAIMAEDWPEIKSRLQSRIQS